jgi:hypothetical protein
VKTVLEIKYDNKATPDIVKMVAKIKDLLKGLRGAYKIYENQNTIEVSK